MPDPTLMLTVLIQDTDIATKREIALKCLINIGAAVEDLKDFLVRKDYRRCKILAMAVHFIRHMMHFIV